MTNTPKLAIAIGYIDDDLVSGAIEYKPSRAKIIQMGWKKWTALVACLAIIITVGAIIPNVLIDNSPSYTDEEIMIKSKYLDIYYVSESNTIESSNIYVRCTSEDIFAEWAKLNNIMDVSLIECQVDNDATTIIKGDPDDPETPVEHHGGNNTTLILTVSSEFAHYAASESGKMLIETLEKTFYSYSEFDTFKLVVQK